MDILMNGLTVWRIYNGVGKTTTEIEDEQKMIERKTYLEMCQKVSVIPSGVFRIKQNVPDDLKVVHNGIAYYPISYTLSFDNGRPTHTATLHDLKANSIINANLETVTKYER